MPGESQDTMEEACDLFATPRAQRTLSLAPTTPAKTAVVQESQLGPVQRNERGYESDASGAGNGSLDVLASRPHSQVTYDQYGRMGLNVPRTAL